MKREIPYTAPTTDMEENKRVYWLSLIGPFCGSYMKFFADSEFQVRTWAAENLPGAWCSVYTSEQLSKSLSQMGGVVEKVGRTITLHVDCNTLYDNY